MLEWSRGRIPRSEVDTEPAERILKLVFGRELCTHDSWLSRAGMTERCLQGHKGSIFDPLPGSPCACLSEPPSPPYT